MEELRAELASLSQALAEHQAAHHEKSRQLEAMQAELRTAKDEQTFWEQMAAEVEAEKKKNADLKLEIHFAPAHQPESD
jgi:type I restriction enzyme R subunit